MGKIFTIKNMHNEIRVHSAKNAKINSRELETLKKRELENLLVPVVVDTGKKMFFSYDTTGYTSLYVYLKKGIKKKEFLNTVYSFININAQIKEKFMQSGNLIMDLNYIFINNKTGNIRYIYVPVTYANNKDNTFEYLKNLPFDCVFDRSETHEYVSQYINYFVNVINFSIYEYTMMLEKINTSNDKKSSKAVVLIDTDNNTRTEISEDVFTIGKNEDCNLRLYSGHVSRNHAQIIFHNGLYYIKDCNSTNHTFLNGKQIEPGVTIKLNHADELRFADKKFNFVIEQ